jgi:CBS domain-containing protein
MASGERSVLLRRLREFVRGPAIACGPDTSAAEIARLLSRHRVGSAVVCGADHAILGIVTDRDLRERVVAAGRDAGTVRVAEIMSAPVIGLGPGSLAFEAILEMTRRDIRHLAVVDEGRLAGVVSMYDFLPTETLHPVVLAREIGRATSLDGLAASGRRVVALCRQLVGERARAYDVGQIVSALNDRMLVRVLALVTEELGDSGEGPPPLPYCWLSFGSEARREQTLRTDQDNGLAFADGPPDLQDRAARYYRRLGEETVRGLERIGVPPCPGGIMASNPRWCQPLSVWRGYFLGWILDPLPERVLEASIHFDLRPLAGAAELAHSLVDTVLSEAPRHPGFLRLLARDAVDRPAALTLLGRIATRRSGAHLGAVDLKGGGAMQLTGAARVHALELGLRETNTIDRFRAAAERGIYTDAEGRDIDDAAQHLMRLRLVHQLEQEARGQPPDNFVVAARLSRADRVLLKEALHTVGRVQGRLRERFATDFAPR